MSTKTRFSSAYDARGLPDVIRAIALHRRPEDPEALTQKEFDESRKQVPEHAHAPSARQICARLGVGWRDLLTALFEPGRDLTRSISRYQGSGADRELSKEHIRAALRMIATQLGVSTLRPAQYDTARAELLAATARRHRHGQSLKLPTAGQIERVAAGWDRALEIAGLDARPPSTGSTKSVVSYDEAVRRFLVSCGAMPSAKELEAFARAQGFPLPRRPQGGHRKAQLEVQAQFAAAGRWAPATPPPKNQPRAYDFGAVTAQKAGESRRSKRRTREECVAAIVAYLEQVPPGEKVSQKRYGAWRGGTQTSCPERVRAARRLDSAACGGAPAPSGRGVVDERASLRRRRGFVVLDSRPQPSVQIPRCC